MRCAGQMFGDERTLLFSPLQGVHYIYLVSNGQLTGMDCLEKETGQLRLTDGREEDTTEQLGLHKMWMVRCLLIDRWGHLEMVGATSGR